MGFKQSSFATIRKMQTVTNPSQASSFLMANKPNKGRRVQSCTRQGQKLNKTKAEHSPRYNGSALKRSHGRLDSFEISYDKKRRTTRQTPSNPPKRQQRRRNRKKSELSSVGFDRFVCNFATGTSQIRGISTENSNCPRIHNRPAKQWYYRVTVKKLARRRGVG